MRPEVAAGHTAPFRLGVNYWPSRTAMGWWTSFDLGEVVDDFARIARSGLDSVRIFLTWEAFQPHADSIDTVMLDRLVAVADVALQQKLALVPTLFTGHMSGVNWIPGWALGGPEGDRRFRVVSGGKVSRAGLRNWYSDSEVGGAQVRLASAAAAALAGHGSLWAWDLGNENSNCVRPPTRAAGVAWLERVAGAIRGADPTALVTTGLHMEDLEEDRRLGPGEASSACDLLCMHGYPIYAPWAESATDELLLPFLADVTRWLGGQRDLVFSEFGLPTYRARARKDERDHRDTDSPLVEEEVAAAYTARALTALQRAGCAGAMLWCYADYDEAIWDRPPLDRATHERSFGLWRADGSPKPSVDVVTAFSGARRVDAAVSREWLDIEPGEFYRAPAAHLPRLYRRFRERAVRPG